MVKQPTLTPPHGSLHMSAIWVYGPGILLKLPIEKAIDSFPHKGKIRVIFWPSIAFNPKTEGSSMAGDRRPHFWKEMGFFVMGKLWKEMELSWK